MNGFFTINEKKSPTCMLWFCENDEATFFENDKLKTTPISNSRQLHMIAIADDLSQS